MNVLKGNIGYGSSQDKIKDYILHTVHAEKPKIQELVQASMKTDKNHSHSQATLKRQQAATDPRWKLISLLKIEKYCKDMCEREIEFINTF